MSTNRHPRYGCEKVEPQESRGAGELSPHLTGFGLGGPVRRPRRGKRRLFEGHTIFGKLPDLDGLLLHARVEHYPAGCRKTSAH
jgi:hypothetical protein